MRPIEQRSKYLQKIPSFASLSPCFHLSTPALTRKASGSFPGPGDFSQPSAMRLSALLALASKVTLPPNYRYGMSRPGSMADKRRNPPGTRRRPVAVEPISDEDWHLFCGDRVRTSGRVEWWWGSWGTIFLPDPHVLPQVEILEGKDAGKQGKVVQVIRERNWVVLEGLNTVSEAWGCGCSGSRSHPALSVRAAQGLALAAGTVRPLSLPFFNMDRCAGLQ